ncbi:MAG TPA: hypothetical protein DCZ93_02050 [Elusimicrobia bacterium]|nr:hypothetical protein [Elusimicrobiota bacterium]
MTNKDKIIAAFLVSAGIFSATQAMQYVHTLSVKDKGTLVSVAKISSGNVLLCDGIVFTTEGGKPKRA